MLYGNQSYLPLILLNLGRVELDGNWNYSRVCSPFLRLYYVHKGEAEVALNDGIARKLRPGHMYLIPPFVQHSNACKGIFVHSYIHVLDQTVNGQNIYEQYSFPFEVEADDIALQLIERLEELNPNSSLQQNDPRSYDNKQSLIESVSRFTQKTPAAQYESQAIMMMLISRFYEHAVKQYSTREDRLIRVQRYIRQNLNRPLPLDELATEASVCKDSLIRLFKRELGITPVEYILNKRIEQAQILLLTQRISIKEVALKLGFYNQSYFSSQFKNVTGMTPLQYRRQNVHT